MCIGQIFPEDPSLTLFFETAIDDQNTLRFFVVRHDDRVGSPVLNGQIPDTNSVSGRDPVIDQNAHFTFLVDTLFFSLPVHEFFFNAIGKASPSLFGIRLIQSPCHGPT